MLTLLVLLPMVVTAIALLPEVTIPIPSVNDDSFHYLFIQNASNALTNGQSIFDQWLPQIDLGFPQFIYYQNLPHLFVIAIQRLLLGSVDLLTIFNVTRYVLLVGFPVTVYWSMRRMGFSQVASSISAAVSSLISGGFLYGFEYDSYIWRGWGMYTQLWAMHLTFITMACVHRALATGRGIGLAVLTFAALVLSHLIYAYLMAITVVVLLIAGLTRANAAPRIVRLGVIGVLAALISSYMTIPFVLSLQYDNVSPYLQSYKYDSYGAGPILTWLATGQLFDVGRLPVLTALLAVGLVVALVARRRLGLSVVALFAVWLVLYFGRPTLGPLVNLLPLHDSLLLHRFIGGVDLAAIILIGIGGAALWRLMSGSGTGLRLLVAGAGAVIVLVPAIQERLDFYSLNTALMQGAQYAISNDSDASAIIATLKTLPPGRVFAGLPATWGNQLHDGDIPFYDRLEFEGIDAVPPPVQSLSLNADYIWDFNDHSQAEYDLYNIRYVVAPTGLAVANFLHPMQQTATYTLYQVQTSGYAEYINLVDWEPVPTQSALFTRNRPWVNGSGPAGKDYVAYDYPSSSGVPSGAPESGCPGGGQILSQSVADDSFAFTVNCSAASPLVIKTTYYPNWHVRVDGQLVPTFMVSPSYIGLNVPAGTHTITAQYEQTPIKTPLLWLGALVLLLTLLLGHRLDLFATALAGRITAWSGRLPIPPLRPDSRRGFGRTAGGNGPEPPSPDPEPEPATDPERPEPAHEGVASAEGANAGPAAPASHSRAERWPPSSRWQLTRLRIRGSALSRRF